MNPPLHLHALRLSRQFLAISLVVIGTTTPGLGAESSSGESAKISAEDERFFNAKILPVLAHSCYECHSHAEDTAEAGLYVDSRAGLMRGGDSKRSPIVPGHPEKSKLIDALRHDVEGIEGMPPDEKLADSVIKDFEEWIRRGAPDPREETKKSTKPTWEEEFDERRKSHWAWQPLKVTPPGQTKDKAWAADEIDRYILDKLEGAGLKPAPPAEKRVLLRRITYDLIGVPPTAKEIKDFLTDDSPDAFAKVVDRLLASPHFGERWGRHWLDLMRYAESYGHEFYHSIHNPHEYRDYVIRALNADISYKQFIHEHIAGDLMETPRVHPTSKFNESIIGTTSWFLGEEVHSPVDILADEAIRHDNQIDVVTRTFLAATVACARCHDHKFDPISAADYYALKGFLQSSSRNHIPIEQPLKFRDTVRQISKLDNDRKQLAARAFGELQRARLGSIEKYLMAAREVLTGGDAAAAAKSRNIDATRLAAWVAYLRRAAGDAKDPLNAVALLARRTDEEFSKTRTEISDRSKQAATRLAEKSPLIQDFSRMDAA
ncbi:MAG: DUF1549 domain-containing protein, partial [Pirellulales bacterium]|nr:DUF1549 domain-containing protein [Pirellulales bacterium]